MLCKVQLTVAYRITVQCSAMFRLLLCIFQEGCALQCKVHLIIAQILVQLCMVAQGSGNCCVDYRSAVQCFQCIAVHCFAVKCSAGQFSAVQCIAVQFSAVQYREVQCSVVPCSTMQCTAVLCSAVHTLSRVLFLHSGSLARNAAT